MGHTQTITKPEQAVRLEVVGKDLECPPFKRLR